MPSKHAVKMFVEGGVYHVYNRGVNKDSIFWHTDDYKFFIFLLQRYLTSNKFKDLSIKDYSECIQLYAMCLMPNHFHLLLEQKEADSMTKFMHSLLVSYTSKINKVYHRAGHIFQGRYKARLMESDADFINTACYIHKNPNELDENIFTYPYSSLFSYAQNSKKSRHSFLTIPKLLSYFGGSYNKYRQHIGESYKPPPR